MNFEEAKAVALAARASGALQIVPKVDGRKTINRRPLTEDERNRIARSIRAYWTPESRALHSQRMREGWKKRKARAAASAAPTP